MAGLYGNVPPGLGAKKTPMKPPVKPAAGGVKPFDPQAFAKMRGGLAQDQAYQQGANQRAAATNARAAAATAAKPVPKKTLLDNIVGVKTRRKMAGM